MHALNGWNPQPAPVWVTCIPSLRHSDLVPDFARRLRSLLEQTLEPKTEGEVAIDLNVSKSRAKEWLQRLVEEGVLEKLKKRQVRYCSTKTFRRLI